MDVAADVVGDGMELGLMPYIGEAFVLGLFLDLLVRLRATVKIDEEQTVVDQARAGARELVA